MAAVEHVSVAVQDDFVERQTRAKPIPALAELIWNGLDGDASTIRIEFAYDDLAGGLSKIVIYDDGEGFPRAEANALFGNLGGSWKRHTRLTRHAKRMIHGQEGRGRYKAFALGQSVTWNVCYKAEGGNRAFGSTCSTRTSPTSPSPRTCPPPIVPRASSSQSATCAATSGLSAARKVSRSYRRSSLSI